MAEGWARALHAGALDPWSAGSAPQRLNLLAVRAMAEAGVDISAQRPKHWAELARVPFDFVITVCDAARGSCPSFPGAARAIHIAFDDPPLLARDTPSDEEAMPHFRRVRDEIRRFIESLPRSLTETVP
jgi:arsenate reductase